MSMNTIKMKQILTQIPQEYIKALDELVQAGYYPSRNEAIRMSVRDLLILHGAHFEITRQLQSKRVLEGMVIVEERVEIEERAYIEG